MKKPFVVLCVVLLGIASLPVARAADLHPPATPEDPASAMVSAQDVLSRLQAGTNAPPRAGAFAPPAAGPTAGAMPTLNEIMAAAPATNAAAASPGDVLAGKVYWGLVESDWGARTGALAPRALSPDSDTVQEGYYAATTLPAVDTNFVAGNVKKNVAIFGVTGTYSGGGRVPKTGQTNSFRLGDDGWWSTNDVGMAWPDPRFTVQANTNLVVDNLTGLMWVRAPHSLPGNANSMNWNQAIDFCWDLNFAGYTDWRLPNILELMSPLDFSRRVSPWILPLGHPFVGLKSGVYYSSTSDNEFAGHSKAITGWLGGVGVRENTQPGFVWPVRGGY